MNVIDYVKGFVIGSDRLLAGKNSTREIRQ
jgi:hypothetical protein